MEQRVRLFSLSSLARYKVQVVSLLGRNGALYEKPIERKGVVFFYICDIASEG